MFKKLLQLKTLLVALLVMTGAGNVWAETVTDVLTASDFTATEATYKSFSNVSKTSDAVYAGQSAKDASGNIQLRSKYSNSGIVSTTSGGKVKSVKITIGSGSNTIDVYGYNKAFKSASDLYNTSGTTSATKVGSLTQTGTITFIDDYEYVGIRSNNGAVYISSIEIVWEVAGGSSTETCATPTFSLVEGTYTSAQNVEISTTTDGATIYYTTDETDPTTSSSVYTEAILVSTTTTIKAMAAKEGMTNSSVATATYDITGNAAPSPLWEETPLEDLTEDDVLVIVGHSSSDYAMSNNNGTSAPTVVKVTIENRKITSNVQNTIKWNVSGNDEEGYIFYPNGSTESWLYCINDNNGVRVGTGDAKHFTLSKNGYLTTTETTAQRYLGIYNQADWRCYTSEGGNIEGQTFTFFRLVDSTLPRLTVSDVNLDYNAESGSVDYTLTNPVTGGVLTATSSEDWLTIGEQTSSTIVLSCSENLTAKSRTATVTLKYSYDTDKFITKAVTVTQKGYVPDYATLPFVWNGGTKDELSALYGVTEYGLGSNYAESNAPYRVKLDTTGDYIQVKTDSQPGKVTICVKMIGGNSNSIITVQESAVGETFSDVESLSISGNQNAELTLETTNEFDSSSRYVRLLFTKGSNVGVGAITIVGPLVSSAGYATFSSTSALDFTNVEDIHAYTATVSGNTISFKRVKKVPANTGLLLRSVNGGAVSTSVPSLTDAADDVTDNAFVAATEEIPSLATTDGDFTNYILNNGSNGVGFYLANNKKVGAGKAYLAVPKTAGVRGFISFDFSDPATGIATIGGNAIEGTAFDLQGRRVNAPKGGLYIINGKKVIVK